MDLRQFDQRADLFELQPQPVKRLLIPRFIEHNELLQPVLLFFGQEPTLSFLSEHEGLFPFPGIPYNAEYLPPPAAGKPVSADPPTAPRSALPGYHTPS